MKEGIFLKVLLGIWILSGILWYGQEGQAGEEKILYGGGIARNVVIACEGGYEFILLPNPSGKMTGWSLKVMKGEKEQEQEIIKGRKNIFQFNGEIIEVENKSITSLWEESKFMMAEVVGEFRIVLRKTEKDGIYHREEDFGGMKSLVIGNKNIEIELIPEKRGAIVRFMDKKTGTDFIYLPSQERIKEQMGFAGQGIIELIGGLVAVIDDKMTYQIKREGNRLVLFLEGSYGDDVKVRRKMEFQENFAGVDISSSIETSKIGGQHWLRHRGEMRLAGDIGVEDFFYYQNKEGEIRKLAYQNTDQYFPGTLWLIGLDEKKKVGLISMYEPVNFETLYIWMGSEFFTWEAWTKKVILGKGENLELKASYFIVTGIEGVDSVTKEGILHIKPIKDCFGAGETVDTLIGVGLCRSGNFNLAWLVEDESGKLYTSGEEKFFCAAGEMKYEKVNWNPNRDGNYLFKVEIKEGEREILKTTKSFLVSSKKIKELENKEKELNGLIEKLKSRLPKVRLKKELEEIKDKLFKMEKARIEVEEYKKSGQIKKALTVFNEATSTLSE